MSAQPNLEPEEAARRGFARYLEKIERARECPNAFIEFCAEITGGVRARQDAVHREWQRIWSAHDRAIVLAPVGHGKSTQLVWRLLWELGRNPDLKIALISSTQGHPKNLLGLMKQEIEENPRVREVFPRLKRAKGARELWTSTEILVERRGRDPNPSVKCFGLHGKILGARADIIVLDDVVNMENSLSDVQREKAVEWLQSEVLSRLKPKAKVWAVGHIWHEADALQVLRKKPGWAYYRYEYRVPTGTIEAANSQDYGSPIADACARMEAEDTNGQEPLSPLVMDEEALREKAEELGPIYTLMMLRNRLPSRAEGRFRRAWFEGCLKLGAGVGMLPNWPSGTAPTYTGVDLGHRKKVGSDLTVLFTVAVLPTGMRQVLDIRSGRWSGPEILDQIRDVHQRYNSIIAVENNSAQQYLLDFAADLDTLPMRPHHTGVNKYDMAHGIESLGHELRQLRWMLPCSHDLIPPPEMTAAISGAMGYDPTRHPSDHLMAWWICREAIRLSPAAQGFEVPDVDHMIR